MENLMQNIYLPDYVEKLQTLTENTLYKTFDDFKNEYELFVLENKIDKISDVYLYPIFEMYILEASFAAKKAKRKGLIHKGFGNYTDEPGGPTIYKTVNGKLAPLKRKKRVRKKSKEEEEASKRKYKRSLEKKQEELDKKAKGDRRGRPKKKQSKSGISGIKRTSGDGYQYEFEYNGEKATITLTDKEYHSGKSIINIIKDKIEHRQKMKDKPVIDKKTKQIDRRKREGRKKREFKKK